MANSVPPPASRRVGERSQSVVDGRLKWVDIAAPTSADMETLQRNYGFHPLDLEDCLTGKVTKVEDHGEHVFILLHFPEEGAGIITSNRIAMFLGKDYLVTLHPGSVEVMSDLFRSVSVDEKKRTDLMKSSPYLAYQILDRMIDCIFLILEDVQGSLDDLEAVVFEEKKSFSTPINQARRQIARLRRIVVPLRLYVPDLSKAQKFSDENLAIYFSDITHKINNISGTVDEMKEMVEIYKDTDFVTSSNRTNDVLSILTILFTLTIPATLLSSIYGMNIPLPGGLSTGPLDFAGQYSSFLVIFILMLIPSVIMVWYFRRAGWF
jgi:magnesium transporter